MTKRFYSFGALLILTLLLGACAGTRYVPYKEGEEPNVFSRTVAYEIDREFYADMPNCIMVMPPEADVSQKPYTRLIESELSHQLKGKFSRVIGPVERRVASRAQALDVSIPNDRRILAKSLNCNAFVFTKLLSLDPTYLLVWSKISVGMDVRLERATDGRVLWRAKTEASRSEGGLPLSPLSIIANGISTARFTADEADVGASIVSDAVRRVVKTLPDARVFETARQRNQL
jgi:hypothetical protein